MAVPERCALFKGFEPGGVHRARPGPEGLRVARVPACLLWFREALHRVPGARGGRDRRGLVQAPDTAGPRRSSTAATVVTVYACTPAGSARSRDGRRSAGSAGGGERPSLRKHGGTALGRHSPPPRGESGGDPRLYQPTRTGDRLINLRAASEVITRALRRRRAGHRPEDRFKIGRKRLPVDILSGRVRPGLGGSDALPAGRSGEPSGSALPEKRAVSTQVSIRTGRSKAVEARLGARTPLKIPSKITKREWTTTRCRVRFLCAGTLIGTLTGLPPIRPLPRPSPGRPATKIAGHRSRALILPVARAERRTSVGIAPFEGRGDARRQLGAAETGIAVEDRLDRVDPQSQTSSGEPLAEKRPGLEGLGVKGHCGISRKSIRRWI